MNLFLVVLAALGMAGLAAVCIRRFLQVPPKEMAAFPVVAAVLVCLLGETLFLLCARLPYLTDRMAEKSVQQLETYMNTIAPDYIDREIGVEDVRTVLSTGRRLNAYTEDNPGIGLIAKAIGLGAYTEGIASLCRNAEGILQEFETEGIAFTPHNLLRYMRDNAAEATRDVCGTLEWIILLSVLLLFGLVYLWYYALLKGWFAPKNSSVVFGDEDS